ncbi:hypothetical protein SLEP1_g59823, partial [Rubroshorea leprosula]
NRNSVTITNNVENILDVLTFLKGWGGTPRPRRVPLTSLPGKVIKLVEQICKNFLWSGSWEKRVISKDICGLCLGLEEASTTQTFGAESNRDGDWRQVLLFYPMIASSMAVGFLLKLTCQVCADAEETCLHLFFRCRYTKDVLNRVMGGGDNWMLVERDYEVMQYKGRSREAKFKHILIAVTIYT